ncbi:MAG: 50S ribosomal protein L6 [Candidatus Micrarchaeota archaeon]|nr:MAG: 50S ribosomal protein L6 [Candidatus Micrarchaeota archaeon]
MIEINLNDKVSAEVSEDSIIIKGPLGTNKRRFNKRLLNVKVEGSKIVIDYNKDKKLERKAYAAQNSLAKEISNDIKGVQEYYTVNMVTAFTHFPMTVEVKGNKILIKNIFGELAPRYADIVGDTKVEVKGQNIKVYGTKLDDVKQTCANMILACKPKNKDIRIFQDGIYYAVE